MHRKGLLMADLFIVKTSKPRQYLYSILAVGVVSGVCYSLAKYLEYHVVGFILLLVVSTFAMIFDILPVLFTAILTALIWDYFFIPPIFTVYVNSTQDMVLLQMYFVVALINAVMTRKIRNIEKEVLLKEEKASTVKLYNTLLSSLSHELRTPIATIIGATDNLQNNSSNLTEQNRHELVDEISKASFRLNQQVENLLNMSRLESGYLQPKNDWCDVTELVHSVVRSIENDNVTQKFSINISSDIPLFKIDKFMMEQIIYNLLINATLYTPPKSKIGITAICLTDVLQLIIEDNGSGFPEKEIKNVFEKFYRLKDSKTGGTGLGLSIVKGYAEAMGGNVSLENISGGGAKFTINIPAQTSYLKNLKNE